MFTYRETLVHKELEVVQAMMGQQVILVYRVKEDSRDPK